MYRFKLPPFEHQLATWQHSKDLAEYAIFWEQGTGKSKVTIDTACHQYLEGIIDAVLVVAPNGVHRNWIVDEIPIHCPDDVFSESMLHCFQTKKKGTIPHKKACQQIIQYKDGLKWLAISYDALMTKEGKKVVKEYLVSNKVFYVLDEAQRIKTPRAKRSMVVIASAKYAVSRRVLTGTPIANSPFDIYNIIKFLEEDFWKPHGFSSFVVFKHFFGIFKKMYNSKTNREFDMLLEYTNLSRLYEIIKDISSRVTKDEVLDLPPKLYNKRYFELSSKQAALYTQLKEEFMILLGSGETITAPLAITRLLRLQQVTCGYLPIDDEKGKLVMIDEKNERLKVLRELIEETPNKTIIWARFTKDIDLIMEMLTELGRKPVRYDGSTGDDDRAKAKIGFQTGDFTDFVANAAAAGEGLTLHAARTVVYYNNSFSLTQRLQSEDRAHRIGQEHPVNYFDLIAQDTVDEYIVSSLREKQSIASLVLGDKFKEWL